jgi:hypothetical protein
MNQLKLIPCLLVSVLLSSVNAHAGSGTEGALVLNKTLTIKGQVMISAGKFGPATTVTVPAGTYKAELNTEDINRDPKCVHFYDDCTKRKQVLRDSITINAGQKNARTIRMMDTPKWTFIGETTRTNYASQNFMVVHKYTSVTKNINYHDGEVECSVKKYCKDAGGWDCIYAMGTQKQTQYVELETTTHVKKFLTLANQEIGAFTWVTQYRGEKADEPRGECRLN